MRTEIRKRAFDGRFAVWALFGTDPDHLWLRGTWLCVAVCKRWGEALEVSHEWRDK